MSTIQEVLNKLQKLKEQASAAPDFLSLQKVAGKVDKIRSKISDIKGNKQLTTIIDKIDLLITQKNKYFRQKMIRNSSKLIADQSYQNQQANKTLKYSKSAESLKKLNTKKPTDSLTVVAGTNEKHGKNGKFSTQINQSFDTQINTNTNANKIDRQKTVYIRNLNSPKNNGQLQILETASQPPSHLPPTPTMSKSRQQRNNNRSMKCVQKNVQEIEDAEKTVINQQQKKLLHGQIDLLQQKLTYSFRQIEDLTKKISILQSNKQKTRDSEQHTSPMAKNLFMKHDNVIDEYSQKIREKGFIIQDLKSKLQYFKSMNEQLKNRVLSQQRRNEDYIDDLKAQIKSLKKQLQKYKKQNQNMSVQIEDLEQKNSCLMSEVKKLVSKLQQQQKQKQKIQRDYASQNSQKMRQLQKQLVHLSNQSRSLQKLEGRLQQQQEQKNNLLNFNKTLQNRINQLQIQSKNWQQQNDKLELSLHKLQEQYKYFQTQLKVNIQAKQLLADELLQTKDKLDQQIRANQLLQYEADIRVKAKLGKLKQIRTLLGELRS